MFRTELPLTPHPQQLPHSARVLTIGSCFSDSIGSRLTEFKVATMANPFGTVFNPISACKLLRAAAGEDMDWQQHLVEARGRWQSHDLHAELGADSPVELLQRIQTLTREAGVFLATADAVVLTLGSAFAYRLRETDEIISNCHKLPADKFEKELLTADDIIAAVAETHAYLRRINPRLRFILTVSPVRHLKDTLVLNSASKSMLRVACHYLSELLPDVTYFPAYELLLDDLRDYRFYATDMLHPSEVAENYVWERFTRTYFDAAFGRFKKEWESLRLALGHRPLYAGAPEHRQFLESTLERLRKISSQADVRMETLHVERELAALPLPIVPSIQEPEYEDDGEERIDIGAYAEETPVTPAAEVIVHSQEAPVRVPEAPSYSRASLLGKGAGMLLETDEPDADDDAAEEEKALPSPVAAEPASAEVAYEHAYAAGLADGPEADEDEDSAEETLEEAGRRKKRRSRGGAKRTKRKHARLAAEAAASGTATVQEEPAVSVPVEPEILPAAETIEAEPASEVVYITEEQLRQPSVTVPAEDSAEMLAEEIAPRVRNNRRDKRERPPRTGVRSGRQPLYAESDADTTAAPAEFEVSAAVINLPEAPALPPVAASLPAAVEIPVTEPQTAEPVAPVKPKAAPKPRVRKAPVRQKPVATTPEEIPVIEIPVAAVAEIAPEVAPEAPAPAAPKPRRRAAPKKKAVVPETVTELPAAPQPVAPVVPEPVVSETPAPVAAARKRAPRKPKVTAVTATPATEPTPAPKPAVIPEPVAAPEPVPEPKPATKRKPRPPRRKPSADAPETT
ncbi:GSCFA domain-containing protein [Hymenobacter perfusus]|uniref:GSCFA domain-containing protein n=1 Tax=Hymenobacter perfusus TaxID=1236770 RepID=A0A3R9NF06_9BACT|nr:GSCFA domain-containing protein [Hymenobacter perfusus]RSK45681.1 hypothetical protein EI293_00475 [Hymenobacter perfusus]